MAGQIVPIDYMVTTSGSGSPDNTEILTPLLRE